VGIPDSIAELDTAVAELLARDDDDNAAVLSAIFKLNNEIGRRLGASGNPVLRNLQLSVNDVTVAAKMLDRRRLATTMAKVKKSALALTPEE